MKNNIKFILITLIFGSIRSNVLDELNPDDYKFLSVSNQGGRFYKKKGGYFDVKFNKNLNIDEKSDFRDQIYDFAYKNEIRVKTNNKGGSLNFFLWIEKWKFPLALFGVLLTYIGITMSPLLDGKCLTYNQIIGKNINLSNGYSLFSYLQFYVFGMIWYGIFYQISIVLEDQNTIEAKFETNFRPFSLYQIGGCEDAKIVLKDVILSLKNAEKCKKYDIKTTKGILFYGPPGTGKTLLAKALAYEMGCPFIVLSPSEFVGRNGAKVIKKFFEVSKMSKRAILFIDELENIALSRNHLRCDKEIRDGLMTLLTELDGFKGRDTELIVIGATNHLQDIDPAIIRAGRFDKVIMVDLPNEKSRYEILKIHGKIMKFDDTVDLSIIAKLTNGFSGAQLAQLLNDVKIETMKSRKESISQNDLIKTRDKTIYGAEIGVVQSKEEIERKSIHESAHALIAHDFCNFVDNYQTSIIPRLKYGIIETIESEAWDYKTRNDYLNLIKCCLASRAIEDINGMQDIYKDTSYDLQKANALAKEMISKFGINSSISIPNDLNDEKISAYIDALLTELYDETKNYLIQNIFRLERLNKSLLKERFINYSQLKLILEVKDLDSKNNKNSSRSNG